MPIGAVTSKFEWPTENDNFYSIKIMKSCKQLSHNLFWDVDIHELDVLNNKRFIIQRVVEYGQLKDWQKVVKWYGLETIGQEMIQVRSLDKVSLAFLSAITGIQKEKFRCYTEKQLLPQHWDF